MSLLETIKGRLTRCYGYTATRVKSNSKHTCVSDARNRIYQLVPSGRNGYTWVRIVQGFTSCRAWKKHRAEQKRLRRMNRRGLVAV